MPPPLIKPLNQALKANALISVFNINITIAVIAPHTA